MILLIAPTSGQLLFIAPSCHMTLIIWFWRSKLTSDPCSNTSHRCGPQLMSMLIRSVEAVQLGFTKRLLGMDLFCILNVWLSLEFHPWTATEFWTLITDYVCSGSVVVTAYDSESGCPGSNPEWGQYSMRLRSLHRAYPSLYPSGVVHWVPEQLNIEAVTGAFKLIDGCSLMMCSATPSVVLAGICHRNKINSTAYEEEEEEKMTLSWWAIP